MRDLETTITMVSGCRDQNLIVQSTTWADLRAALSGVLRTGSLSLAEYMAAPDAVRKEEKDGPAWIPCSVRNPAGGRRQENMDQVYYMVLDLDGGTSIEVINSTLAGNEYVVHSSYSHSQEKSKFRVVMPLKQPIPAKDIGRVFDHFQALFGENELDAACGHDPARLYYLPACPADAEALFSYEYHEGDFVDAKAILAATCAGVSARVTHTAPKAGVTAPGTGVPEGGRNNAAFKRACSLFEDGLEYDDVLDDLLAWNAKNTPPLDERELKGVAKSAKKHVSRQEVADKAAVEAVVDEMNAKFAWSIKQNRVYRFDQRDFVLIEALRQQFANTSLLVRTNDGVKRYSHADIWFRDERRRNHQDVDFYPGEAPIFNDRINLWTGWPTTPASGDVRPWVELLDHFFGADLASRKWFEQWLAYPIQHPGAKLTTSVVLWSSTQGVGKSLIGETMCKLYGAHGKVISANELHSQYNGWMRDVQFVLGEENDSKDQRADANRLKLLITGTRVFVNEKYQPATETRNCVNFLFTSNHADAFYLEDADRRFFIWEIAAPRKSDAFYDHFVRWRDDLGGLPALMEHLMSVDLTGFLPYGNAPVTAAKLEMIQQSKSELERVLGDMLEDAATVRAVFGSEVATLEDVSKVCRARCASRPTETAVSRAFRRQTRSAKKRVSLGGGRRHMMQSLANHDYWDRADPNEWVDEYAKLSLTAL